MVGEMVVVFRSFLTAIGQLERDTHIPSAELKGMEWMKFQSLPCRHTLCFAHISTEMFTYSTMWFQPGFLSCAPVSDMVLLCLMRNPNPVKTAPHARWWWWWPRLQTLPTCPNVSFYFPSMTLRSGLN